MAQYSLANAAGAAFRSALNTVLGKLHGNYAGTTDPVSASEQTAGMFWLDTSSTPAVLKIRNAANSAWISIGEVDTSFLLNGTTSFIRTLLDDADAATARATLGINPAFEFVDSQDASNDPTLVFTGFDATKYDAYVFEVGNLVPATDNVSFYVRTSTDGGSTYDSGASDYAHARHVIVASTSGSVTPVTVGNDADSKIFIGGGYGSAAGEDGFSGTFKVLHPHLAKKTIITWDGSAFDPSGFLSTTKGSGARLASEDVDAIQFSFSSGNIESGTITMYGLRNN